MFVTSFWMRPTLVSMLQEEDFKKFNFDLWCAALQAMLFNKWNMPLTMVTDFGGSLYFSKFPYTKLKVVDYPQDYIYFINDLPKLYTLSTNFNIGNIYIDYHTGILSQDDLYNLNSNPSTCIICDQKEVPFKKKTLFKELQRKHIIDFEYSDTYIDTDIYKNNDSSITRQYVNRAFQINNKIKENIKTLCTTLYNVDLSVLLINNGLQDLFKDATKAKDIINYHKFKFENYETDLQYIKQQIQICDSNFYKTMIEFEQHILTAVTKLPEEYSQLIT